MFGNPNSSDNNDPRIEVQDITKKREEIAVQIRRGNREDIISKRRNMALPASSKKEAVYEDADIPIQAQIESYKQHQYTMEEFPKLVECCKSRDPLEIYFGAIGIRKILSDNDEPPIQKIIDANLVPRLIEFAKQTQHILLRVQATWALTNIASGSPSQCQSIVDKGGISLFVSLLESPRIQIVEQAIWALGNIAGDSYVHRDSIIKLGGLTKLKNIVDSTTNKVIINQGGWALANLCRGSPKPAYESIKEAVETFCYIIRNRLIDDIDIISDILWALSFLSDGSKTRISRVVNTGVVATLVSYLAAESQNILIPSLRILGNIAFGNELHTEEVLKHGSLAYFENCLNSSRTLVRRETCWVLSNITAGVRSQSLAVMSHEGIVRRLVQLIENDAPECQREICYIFSNAVQTCEPNEIITLIRQHHILMHIIKVLGSIDDKAVLAALEAIQSLLKVGEKIKQPGTGGIIKQDLHAYGGIEALENLQTHKNVSVYKKVILIVQTFFAVVDPLP